MIFSLVLYVSTKPSVTPAPVIDEVDGKNTTSSQELLDEVLRKLELLDNGKRSIILNMLRKQPGTNNKTATVEDMNAEQAVVDDEVLILDMEEPKMGKYKRKRSK